MQVSATTVPRFYAVERDVCGDLRQMEVTYKKHPKGDVLGILESLESVHDEASQMHAADPSSVFADNAMHLELLVGEIQAHDISESAFQAQWDVTAEKVVADCNRLGFEVGS